MRYYRRANAVLPHTVPTGKSAATHALKLAVANTRGTTANQMRYYRKPGTTAQALRYYRNQSRATFQKNISSGKNVPRLILGTTAHAVVPHISAGTTAPRVFAKNPKTHRSGEYVPRLKPVLPHMR